MYKESKNHVNHTEDGCPHPHVARQVARDWIPPSQQEIPRPDQECQSEEPKGDVTSSGGQPRKEQPVLYPVRVCRLVPTVIGGRGCAV